MASRPDFGAAMVEGLMAGQPPVELLVDNLPTIGETVTPAELEAIGQRILPLVREDAERQFRVLDGLFVSDEQLGKLVGMVHMQTLWHCAEGKVHESVAFLIVRTIEDVLRSIVRRSREAIQANPPGPLVIETNDEETP